MTEEKLTDSEHICLGKMSESMLKIQVGTEVQVSRLKP